MGNGKLTKWEEKMKPQIHKSNDNCSYHLLILFAYKADSKHLQQQQTSAGLHLSPFVGNLNLTGTPSWIEFSLSSRFVFCSCHEAARLFLRAQRWRQKHSLFLWKAQLPPSKTDWEIYRTAKQLPSSEEGLLLTFQGSQLLWQRPAIHRMRRAQGSSQRDTMNVPCLILSCSELISKKNLFLFSPVSGKPVSERVASELSDDQQLGLKRVQQGREISHSRDREFRSVPSPQQSCHIWGLPRAYDLTNGLSPPTSSPILQMASVKMVQANSGRHSHESPLL